MTHDLTDILRGTSLLASVPVQDLEAIRAASRLRSFRRGQVVFTRGDPSDSVIVVVSGRVKVTIRSAEGGVLTLAVIRAGGMFGELGVADDGPRSGDAETLEDCQLLLIPRETIQDICARLPSAAQALARRAFIRETCSVRRSMTSSSSPSCPGSPSSIFSASSACRLPKTPGTGPSTPASAQLPTRPSRVACGQMQRKQAPWVSGRITCSCPSY